MTERTPEAERAALDILIHSDGWEIVKAIVANAYGAAQQIQEIDDLMVKLQPGDDQLAVVTQIRAAAKAANDVIVRTESRFSQLEQAEKAKSLPERAFESFRRVRA